MTGSWKRQISVAEYDALPAMRSSRLKNMKVSPLYFNHMETLPYETTDAKEFGTAVHCAVLEPARFETAYRAWHGKVRAGKIWDATVAAYPNCKHVSGGTYREILTCRDSILKHPDVAKVLNTRHSVEVSLGWMDEKTGIACKARPDIEIGAGWVGENSTAALVGIKTARSINRRRFAAQAEELGYVLSWGMYFEGYRVVTGQKADMFEIVVENEPPYDVAVFRITSDVVDEGVDMFHLYLHRVMVCRETGRWPGQYEKVTNFERPGWAQSGDDE